MATSAATSAGAVDESASASPGTPLAVVPPTPPTQAARSASTSSSGLATPLLDDGDAPTAAGTPHASPPVKAATSSESNGSADAPPAPAVGHVSLAHGETIDSEADVTQPRSTGESADVQGPAEPSAASGKGGSGNAASSTGSHSGEDATPSEADMARQPPPVGRGVRASDAPTPHADTPWVKAVERAGTSAEGSVSGGAGGSRPASGSVSSVGRAKSGSVSSVGSTGERRRPPGPGDFLFGAELGEGAYARVLHCRHKRSGRDYAVKVMEKRFIRKEGKVAFVMNEKRILSSSNHPNIVKLLFTFHDSQYLYMVMELCRAGELLRVIRKKAADNRVASAGMSVDLTRFYVAQVVDALEYLHQRNIVHRDLKPENVLIDDTGHVKVTDFGTAKDASHPDSMLSNDFAGTAEYVAPEVLHDKPAGREVDLWAVGCILYECLRGKRAFGAESEYLTFQQVMNYPESHVLDFPASFPADAKDLVQRLMKVEPSERLGAGEPGSGNGMAELKAHAFWGRSFDALLKAEPPYIPSMPALPEPREGGVDSFEDDLEPMVLKHSRRASVREILDAGEIERLRVASQHAGGAGGRATGDGTEYWRAELSEGETPILWAVVDKRKGLFSKTRELVLTSRPRLVYFDPDPTSLEKKGEIPWTAGMKVELKGSGWFDVGTPGRTYHIRDKSAGGAERWKGAIEEQLRLHSDAS